MNFWPQLRKAAESGLDFKMTKGDQIRDYISVQKVAKTIISELIKNSSSNTFIIKNIGGMPNKHERICRKMVD